MFNMQTGGIFMAFTRYRLHTSFRELEWVGLHWFQTLWARPDFWQALRNTLIISFGRLFFEFPVPIMVALLLNEVKRSGTKRVLQTVFTFPHFLSWIIVYSLMMDLFSVHGFINSILRSFGRDPILFLIHRGIPTNLALIFGTSIWRSAGWSAIIYLASISGIDPSLYEAARVDGGNRWHCMRHITWPGIKSTAVVLMILACGSIMNGGFDQIFQFINGANQGVLDILDTYIFRFGFGGMMNPSFAAAAGLFTSVINFALLLTANRISRLLGSEGLF